MRIKDVPVFPAYVVFHDSFDGGAMDVYPAASFELASKKAQANQNRLDESGEDECGIWKAYEKLPRVRVHKVHPEVQS